MMTLNGRDLELELAALADYGSMAYLIKPAQVATVAWGPAKARKHSYGAQARAHMHVPVHRCTLP